MAGYWVRPSTALTERIYRGGETVPPGSYVCLEDGRLHNLREGGSLPVAAPIPDCFLRVSEGPVRDAAELPAA